MERTRLEREIRSLQADHEASADREVAAVQTFVVCLFLLDVNKVLGRELQAKIKSGLEKRFNVLDQSFLRTVRFRFEVVYRPGEPTDKEKAAFRALDFPLYLLNSQHSENTISDLMEKHRIPQTIRNTDIYKYARDSWSQEDVRGVGIPSDKGHRKVGFIKAQKILDQANDAVKGFVNCIMHETGHMGNRFRHSKSGVMKYPLLLDADLDFEPADRIAFLADVARLRKLGQPPMKVVYVPPPIFREYENFPIDPSRADMAGSRQTAPFSLFPPTPEDPLSPDRKMTTALTEAVARAEKAHRMRPGSFPVRFTIVDITSPTDSFPTAGYLENETDYIASEAKVSVMYAAYALRDMVRRFAAATGSNAANLFHNLAKAMNPAIINASRAIARSLLMNSHRTPSYGDVFALTPTSFGMRVEAAFSPTFKKALDGMIVPSDNLQAGRCVRGVGYGYLNGALQAAGLFDPVKENGLWVAGDFQEGKKWPYVRIVSRNDGLVAQAGTTRAMAKLVSMIMTDRVLDPASCDEMRRTLARAARGIDTPWIARTSVFRPGTITHNKLGLGPLKSGRSVRSEVSVYDSAVKKGRRYVVAWQNLTGLRPVGFNDIASIIKSVITEFET